MYLLCTHARIQVLNLEPPYILHCTVQYTSVLYCFPTHFNVTVYCTVFQDTSEQDLASFDDDVIKRTKRSKIYPAIRNSDYDATRAFILIRR